MCTQVLGDLATVQDHKRQLAGLRIALLSAGGPVTASWLRAARALRLQLTCVCPPGHEPDVTTVTTVSERRCHRMHTHRVVPCIINSVVAAPGCSCVQSSLLTLLVQQPSHTLRPTMLSPPSMDLPMWRP